MFQGSRDLSVGFVPRPQYPIMCGRILRSKSSRGMALMILPLHNLVQRQTGQSGPLHLSFAVGHVLLLDSSQ